VPADTFQLIDRDTGVAAWQPAVGP
jgi:hypothetical protein